MSLNLKRLFQEHHKLCMMNLLSNYWLIVNCLTCSLHRIALQSMFSLIIIDSCVLFVLSTHMDVIFTHRNIMPFACSLPLIKNLITNKKIIKTNHHATIACVKLAKKGLKECVFRMSI